MTGSSSPERSQPPMLVADDLFHAGTFAAAGLIARTLPEARWPAAAERFAALSARVRRRRDQQDAVDLAACLSALHPDPEARRTAGRAMVANLFEEKVMFHRAAHEPAWRPPITLEGADALASALARGGAVLWVAPVTFATLVVKMVLADAGFRVLHLSRVGHGGGRSRVGIRLNNDWQNKVEERFVTRIVMPRQGSSASTVRALKKGLESGGVVSITAIDIADRPVERDFLGGTIRLATGAPRLAERHGASLFAVLTTRDRGRRFRVRLVPLGADTVEARTTVFCDLFASALRHSPDLLRRGMTSYREAPRDALR